MRIGLVDVDGHNYPNLALMKLSAWHKAQGDDVSFASPLEQYDKVYKSKVFTFSDDDQYFPDADKGGTGYGDYAKTLSDEVEHIYPDYSLYGMTDTAYGFTTRGCIRKCPFCVVNRKEGMIRPHADFREFWRGQSELILMDNNIFACDHGIRQIEEINRLGIAVDVNQGIDARLVAKSKHLVRLMAGMKPFRTRGLRIACDLNSEIEPCHTVIRNVLEMNPKAYFIVFCILTDDYEDSLNRVSQWRQYGHHVAVYAPPYRNFDDPNQRIPRWQKDMSRWASNHIVYYGCEWDEYKKGNRNEQEESLF